MQHNKLSIGIQMNLPSLQSAFGRFQRLVSKAVKDREISFHYAQKYDDLVTTVAKSSDKNTDVILIHASPYSNEARGLDEHRQVLAGYNKVNKDLRSQVANMAQLELITQGEAHFSEPSEKSSLLEETGTNNLPQQLSGLSDDSGSGEFLKFLSWFDQATSERSGSLTT